MAVTETTPTPSAPGSPEQTKTRQTGETERLLGSGDHTLIGRLYIGFSLIFLISSLIARIVVGIDTGTTNGLLGVYQQMVSNSATIGLIFLGVVPFLLGIAMLVVPLQIGAPAIAFPRAAALSMWSWLVFAAVFVTSMAIDGGIGGGDTDGARLGNVAFGAILIALAVGVTCVATTVITHRPEGMTLARVPLFAWSMLVAGAIWVTTIGAAIAFVLIAHLNNGGAADYFTNFATNLSWLLRGPAIFMLAIPILGIAADVVVTATQRPLMDYKIVQALIGGYGVLSFGAWAVGNTAVNTFVWALWAVLIALPILGLLGAAMEALRHGKPRINAALIGSLLSLCNLLGAVAIGLLMAINTAGSGTVFDFGPTALASAQTVFVIAAAVTGGLAAMAYWSVKIWGTEANDKVATASVALADIGGGLLATVLAVSVFVQGSGTTGESLFGWLVAICGLIFLCGVVTGVLFSIGSTDDDDAADVPENPFDGVTLEWQTPSPAEGAERTAELPAIENPYPLRSAKESS